MFDHCHYSLHFFHSEISAFVLAFVHASVLTSVVREIMHWSGFQMADEKPLQNYRSSYSDQSQQELTARRTYQNS